MKEQEVKWYWKDLKWMILLFSIVTLILVYYILFSYWIKKNNTIEVYKTQIIQEVSDECVLRTYIQVNDENFPHGIIWDKYDNSLEDSIRFKRLDQAIIALKFYYKLVEK